jgi:hypothetical protein
MALVLENHRGVMGHKCKLVRQHQPGSSYSDEDITPLDTNNNPSLNVQGPITRARARQLNLEVSSFLNSSS